MELTKTEREAILEVLRTFRDRCPEEYNKTLTGYLGEVFCNAWDKLKQ